jgi:casein kinase II subunit beta
MVDWRGRWINEDDEYDEEEEEEEEDRQMEDFDPVRLFYDTLIC